MNLEEIIFKRRTIRRFKQDPIPLEKIKKLIDYARVAPVAMNIQGVEYIIVHKADIGKKLFPFVSWASSLPENERTPEPGREPTAYIIVLVNTEIKKAYVDFDVGASVQNILLGAVYFNIGTCWMGAINKEKIRKLLDIPNHYEIKQVISLGYPDEESMMEPYKDTFKYWKDNEGRMHVPKRALEDIVFKIF
jgi:nitroreductase